MVSSFSMTVSNIPLQSKYGGFKPHATHTWWGCRDIAGQDKDITPGAMKTTRMHDAQQTCSSCLLMVLTAHTSAPSQRHSQGPECQASCRIAAFFASSVWYSEHVTGRQFVKWFACWLKGGQCMWHACAPQKIDNYQSILTLYCLVRTALAFLWASCLAAKTAGVQRQAAHEIDCCWAIKQTYQHTKLCKAPQVAPLMEKRRLRRCFGCQTRSQVRRCKAVGTLQDCWGQ